LKKRHWRRGAITNTAKQGAMADANHSDRARLTRFWASAREFWGGKSAMIAWPLTVGLVVIAVSQLSVQYRLNYWNRDFFNALARRDNALWHQVAVFVPLAIMSVGLSVVSVWARAGLATEASKLGLSSSSRHRSTGVVRACSGKVGASFRSCSTKDLGSAPCPAICWCALAPRLPNCLCDRIEPTVTI
jgi:hypothetical protein